MKILVVGDSHGSEKVKKISLKGVDLVLMTGDVGKADMARERYFENIERKKQGLGELEYDGKFCRLVYREIYDSTLDILRYFSKKVPTYSILGNVGMRMVKNKEVEKEERKYDIKLPYLRDGLNKLKDFHLVRNGVRNIEGLRIGFLEYFVGTSWVREFKPSDYKKSLKNAKRETEKVKGILKNFKDLDILVCHQPPYGILDKMTNKQAPKHWYGKHAGSKVILDYIKKKQPRYVFCGHIHEGKGMKKIGRTEIYNVGCCGDYIILDGKDKS